MTIPDLTTRLIRAIIFAVFIVLLSCNAQWQLAIFGCPEPWPLIIALLVTVPAALGGSRYVNLPAQPLWESGTCGWDAKPARRHRIHGNVQFVLHPAGTQNHFEDYWHNFDSSWWPTFEAGPVASFDYGTLFECRVMARRLRRTGAVEYRDYNNTAWLPTTPDIAAQFKPGFKN